MKALILFFIIWNAGYQMALAQEANVVIRAPIDDSRDVEAMGIAHSKKHKLQYIMRDCPVIGNTESGIYHTPGQPNYKQMLIVNKCAKKSKCKDNRKCFDDEAEAMAAQFCTEKEGCRPYKKSTAVLK